MCSKADDPSQHDEEGWPHDYGQVCECGECDPIEVEAERASREEMRDLVEWQNSMRDW